MCLVGMVHLGNGEYIAFKNRDLQYQPDVDVPRFLAKTQEPCLVFPVGEGEGEGIWAGVNRSGVSFQFSDIYVSDHRTLSDSAVEEARRFFRVFHQDALQECRSASDAVMKFIDLYQSGSIVKRLRQIMLVCGRDTGAIVEIGDEQVGIEWLDEHGYLIRSNWPVVLGVRAPQGEAQQPLHISAKLRAQRAIELIEQSDDWGVECAKRLLCDEKYGKTGMSICRHSRQKGYRTTSSVIVHVMKNRACCYYNLEGPPCGAGFREKKLPQCNGGRETC